MDNQHWEDEAEGQMNRNTLGLPDGIYCSEGSRQHNLRDCTCELPGDKTSKLNSHYFFLSEIFLCGRAETNLHFSLGQCHVVLCT